MINNFNSIDKLNSLIWHVTKHIDRFWWLGCEYLPLGSIILPITVHFFLKYSWFTLLCQFLLYSIVTQSYICIHTFSHTILHHVLFQDIGHSSLCCTVGPHCFSSLNIIVCIYQPQTSHPSHSLPSPPGNHKFVLHVCEYISVLISFSIFFLLNTSLYPVLSCPFNCSKDPKSAAQTFYKYLSAALSVHFLLYKRYSLLKIILMAFFSNSSHSN